VETTAPARRARPLPEIGIIAGDPSGIGPEVTVKAVCKGEVLSVCRPVLIGSRDALLSAAERWAAETAGLMRTEGDTRPRIRLLDVRTGGVQPEVGRASSEGGTAAFHAITRAFGLLDDGSIAGAAMAPIAKEALHSTGYGFASEFELFAHLCGVACVRGVVKCGGLFRATVTGHIPFGEIVATLTTGEIEETGRALWHTMRQFGVEAPQIGVAALNPHAGEGGMLGDEEAAVIAPAVRRLSSQGIHAQGPFPADTILSRARQGAFRGVVFLYHDQGNIAFKAADFGSNVVVFTGIPHAVTTVGHGTAFDIAGQGIADEGNMVQAILAAAELIGSEP